MPVWTYSVTITSVRQQNLLIHSSTSVHLHCCEPLEIHKKKYIKINRDHLETVQHGIHALFILAQNDGAHFVCVRPATILQPMIRRRFAE